jgi:RNase P/RNase MRP subunit p29
MNIGKTIRITAARNQSLVGKKGLVIDETKNTITIRTTAKNITIIKDQITTFEEENG